ncbi:MAG: ABC transporter permease [Chloroflexi bacterium]|nr:ABC transporter permease [Chloroflexota bacterium]
MRNQTALADLDDQSETPGLSLPSSVSTVMIRPSSGWASLDIAAVWQYRELLYFMAWRDIKVRYKQSLLGVSWAVLQPLLTAAIFSVFFGMLAKIPSDGIPYPLFAYAAMVPWIFCAYVTNSAANSLVANARLITKVYFPRLIIPLSVVLTGLLDLTIAFVVLLVMTLLLGRPLTAAIATIPLLVTLAAATALGLGMLLAALYAKYRDIGSIVPFIVQVWFFMTPIVYSSSLAPERWRTVYALNPMVTVVEGFRWAVLSAAPPSLDMVMASTLTAVVLLTVGLVSFRQMERGFADII